MESSDQDFPEEKLDVHSFFHSIYQKSEDLRSLARTGQLGSLHNRFIIWRIFLNIFPETGSMEDWLISLRKYRKNYENLKNSLNSLNSVEAKNMDPSIFNPLSQASENPWNEFYQDNELKQTIRNDVDRTFQERALFQKEETKAVLLQVLFIWAKKNSIGYRQGMNELLAVFFIVAFLEKAENIEADSEEVKNLILEFNDPKFIEADIFEMFSKLMDLGVKEMFLPVMTKKPKLLGNLISFDKQSLENDLVNSDKSLDAKTSSILKKCHRVHHRLLPALDKQLYNFIESQKIEPQIYLQRWLRCMLTREFNLANTLVLWDSIFADVFILKENKIESFTGKLDFTRELIFLEFLSVAMVIFVRSFRIR
jgi:TBC1 domain family protein 5